MRSPTRVRRCPRCLKTPLEPCLHEGRPVDLCPRCRGLWCEPSHWDREQLGPFPRFAADGRAPAAPAPDVRYVGPSSLNCPGCRRPLADLEVGRRDGEGPEPFEIDQCEQCGGVWFDSDEWDALQAYRAWQEEEKQLDTPTTWGQWTFQFFLGVPLEFNVPPRRFPSVTVGLIVLCVLVFALQVAVGPQGWEPFALKPDRVLTPAGLLGLFTCMFLHGGVPHLLGNMYFLYLLGVHVEDVLGHVRYLVFYLACGVAAGLTYVAIFFTNDTGLVGASGAIAGVMAAYALLFPRARLTFMLIFWQWKVSPWVWMGIFLALQVIGAAVDLGGKSTGVAHFAHLGGFVAGLAIIYPLRRTLIAGHPLLRLLHTWRRPRALESKAAAGV
jgi:membrane associated rhomboid family serine protease